jgi:uncharacterized protein (DUF1697 family)
VQTYIASGNVVFASRQSAGKVKAALEKRLRAYAGKPMNVMVRTAEEMKAVLASNPFPEAAPNRTVTIFLGDLPPSDALNDIRGRKDEESAAGQAGDFRRLRRRHGAVELKIPAAEGGTARNRNTIAKLIELAGGGETA